MAEPPIAAETARPTNAAAITIVGVDITGSARKLLKSIARKTLASTATQKTGSE